MIPVYKPSIGQEEKDNVNECLETSWISSRGKFVEQFEKSFAQSICVNYAVSVCNGTVALHLALVGLDIAPGDEIIVPTFTYVASVNCIKYCGAMPVFVDSCQHDWQMDPKDIERKITSKTKAILCVHLYGHPCDMTSIMQIAKKHNLYVIEDCAEAFGSKHHEKYVGGFGDVATFSFFGNKTITTGEGGMVVTNNQTVYNKLVHFRGQGVSPIKEYWHDVIGYNYRMTNIAAAIGVAQLKRKDEFISKKRHVASLYQSLISDRFTFHKETPNNFHTFWMCSILLPEGCSGVDRDKFRKYLSQNNIETRPLFYPIHNMPMYSKDSNSHPIAQNISIRGVNLPSFPALTDDEIYYIINIINSWK